MKQAKSTEQFIFTDPSGNNFLKLPCSSEEVLPGIRWGDASELFTPSFWKHQAVVHIGLGTYQKFSLGCSLKEELAACLLGGYGIPAELGLAAFERLQVQGLLRGRPCQVAIEEQLSQPFLIGSKPRKYRFWRQKAKYLAASLSALDTLALPSDHQGIREQLMRLPGIGPKTASWIVRNQFASNQVAILDIHIIRACVHLRLFPNPKDIARQYAQLEIKFLQLCQALSVPAALLDALMWDYMRSLVPMIKTRDRSISGNPDSSNSKRNQTVLNTEDSDNSVMA